jgi:chromosome partitioning protein
MMICLANTKGGVGKSTIAVHLAVWLFDQGFKTALLDADKQRSSSEWVSQAEEKITMRVCDSPDSCLFEAKELLRTHDFVVGDGPGGLDDLSRAMLLKSDFALLPISPSVLDLRSVKQATGILRFAQEINDGLPEGRLILNKMRTRDTISRELKEAAPGLGVVVANTVIRDLQAYRDAAQQGTTVTRMGRKGGQASDEISRLFAELFPQAKQTATDKEVANG